MQADLDVCLRGLAAEPVHPDLGGLESAVFSRIAMQARDVSPARFALLVAAVAVTMGVGSAEMPAATAQAAPILSPFGPSSPLAPSTLLAEAR